MSNRVVRRAANLLLLAAIVIIIGSGLLGVALANRGGEFIGMIIIGVGVVIGLVGGHRLVTNVDYLADREAKRHEMELRAAAQEPPSPHVAP